MPPGRSAPARRLLVAATLSVAPAVAVVLVACAVSLSRGEDIIPLLLDPAELQTFPSYVGMVSQLGLMLWAAAAAVALVAARDDTLPAQTRRALLGAALLSLVLALDDGFLLHELIGARLPGGELISTGLLALVAVAALGPCLQWLLLREDRLILCAVVALLGLSVLVDLGHGPLDEVVNRGVVVLAEEGTKFCGIALWLAYLVSLSRRRPAGRGRG